MGAYVYHLEAQQFYSITTFKCEGCGRRLDKSKLMGKSKNKFLDKGQPHDTNERIILLTCSLKCSKMAQKHTLKELIAWIESNYGN